MDGGITVLTVVFFVSFGKKSIFYKKLLAFFYKIYYNITIYDYKRFRRIIL